MKPYNNFTIKVLLLFIAFFFVSQAYSQEPANQKKQPTREEIMNMSYDQLLNMPFEDLINLASIMGVSADELLQMILNKDVSSASKSKEKVFQSPLSTTVISKEEIAASGALSIPEALRMVPGMIVREKTPGNFDVHIRGNDNVPPKNMYLYTEDAISLIMIDNRPVYNYSFGGTFWETLPIDLNDVERIEVIRGPSSALYGPNAVAGVINIITKQADSKKLSASGNVQLGTLNSKIANIGLTGGLGNKFKFRVSGNYQYQERFQKDFYVFDLNKYVSYDELDSLHYYWSQFPQQRGEYAYEKLHDGIRNARLATDKYGVNAFMYYNVNDKVNFNLSTGTQQSEIVSTTLGNYVVPFTGRYSNTQYVDFKANVHGFSFQSNYLFGRQDVSEGSVGYKIKPHIFNSQLEYEYKMNKLTLRPGVSYSHTVYSDKGYVDAAAHEGFLNGDRELSDLAGFIRADYKPIESLRIIAALRADKYDVPDKTYFTYQFIGTYNLDKNNLLRFVYSRANRGPFIVDSHGNYNWEVIKPHYYDLAWNGNKNLKLPVMDMFELGYRTKIGQHIMIDLEAFHTKMKDYSYFIPDSMRVTANWGLVLQGMATAPSITNVWGDISYYNFDLQSIQNGITCNISVAVNKKLNFRIFGTLQETKLKNFYPLTIWQDFSNMIQKPLAADGAILADPANPERTTLITYLMTHNYTKTYHSSNQISNLTDITQKSTPTFYGGATLDFTPTDKLNLFFTAYYYSNQTIMTNKVDVTDAYGASDMYKVKAKIIPSVKVSYKFWKDNSIYLNARNFLGTDNKEFAYTDKIGSTYMVGVNFNF